MSTFVSVGNATQPFDRLINGVISNMHLLPAPIYIQHGNSYLSNKNLDINTITATKFLNMNQFESKIKECEILILHAGAGSSIHAIKSGKIPIIMPRLSKYGEHVDDHQLELALELDARKLAVILKDFNYLSEAILNLKTIFNLKKINSKSVLFEEIDNLLYKYLNA